MEKKVIALGFFDGVHLGHGTLLKRASELAAELNCKTMAVTFDRHPSSVITGRETPLLSSQKDRAYLLKTCYHIDEVEFLHFGRNLMHMPWEEFLRLTLVQELQAAHVVCGWDYRFGYRGEGTAEKLAAFCRENGIGCDVLPEYTVNGTPVHSTGIRELLKQGKTEEAALLLGHPHLLSGRVISGKQLGRTLGTPTANLAIPAEVLPLPNGVYATLVEFDGVKHPAVTNVGNCPTVSESAPMRVEAWLLDWSGNLYDREIHVEFYKMLRPEIRFESVEALQAEILKNGRETCDYFSKRGF